MIHAFFIQSLKLEIMNKGND